MCKRSVLSVLALCLALCLCACGDTGERAQPGNSHTAPNDPNLGLYLCTSVKVDDMDVGAAGQWIQLEPQGKAILSLTDETDEGQWSLAGSSFTLTVADKTVAAGTLDRGVLTLDLLGAQCVFLRDGAAAPESDGTESANTPEGEDDLPPPGFAYLSCYGDLYRITYPTDRFWPSSDGLTDLVGQDGTLVWLTRLDSKEAAEQWLTGYAARANDPNGSVCELLSLTVAEYPATAVVYQDGQTWHSAVVVEFGKNKGSHSCPMYAACLSFSGPSREAVWNEITQAMAASLSLTL
ncbi:MAG: hypothetical protein HUJ67_05670 [Ruminiclostridium sp.]|nr:hypothetical protein [Ruminiclostridium sp.]